MKTIDRVQQAFGSSPKLQKETLAAISRYPELENLFDAIACHAIDQQAHAQSCHGTETSGAASSENPSKKRRLNNGDGVTDSCKVWSVESYSTIKELSFTVPQRKKLTLELGDPAAGLRTRNPATNEVEFGASWNQVQHVVCLPLPEKAQAQYTFCVFPFQNDGITALAGDAGAPDQISWTVPNTKPKPGMFSQDLEDTDESIKSIMVQALNEPLKKRKLHVIEPDEKEFASEMPQAQRKGEKAVHVKAFRGNKEGFLFFLSTGIVWGFKKPLIFFAFDSIDSISYTSILQRTFNLNINARGADPSDEAQEFEFAMVDQADFAGIDSYIKRHGLQDASMAEQRRAKRLNINGVKGENADEDEDEPGKLAKATQEAENAAADEDEEEEDDENFDPGSEGESEGEGTSDEEEDGNGSAADANDEGEDDV